MLPPTEQSWTVSFGPYVVDLRTGELRKQGLRIRLQEKSFQILSALLEKPGELVTREELRQRLWPDSTFVDWDNGLNTALTKLRDALGDSAEKPRYIETFPRRGYRFIALSTPAAMNRIVMLAVLPFDNLSGDVEQEYFSDGLTEEMITALARLRVAILSRFSTTSWCALTTSSTLLPTRLQRFACSLRCQARRIEYSSCCNIAITLVDLYFV
jgi:DNA-binding winged helix-turn-helix (wHTH) protein